MSKQTEELHPDHCADRKKNNEDKKEQSEIEFTDEVHVASQHINALAGYHSSNGAKHTEGSKCHHIIRYPEHDVRNRIKKIDHHFSFLPDGCSSNSKEHGEDHDRKDLV